MSTLTSRLRLSKVTAVALFSFTAFLPICGCGTRNDGNTTKSNDTNLNSDVDAPANVEYKIYVENSSSMNGYFNAEDGAKDIRLDLLKLTEALDIDSMCFVNSKEIDVTGNIVETLKTMTLAKFKKYGQKGNPAASDIAKNIQLIVGETPSSGQINFLVSDFIFTPARNQATTDLGPESQSSTIAKIFRDKNLSVAIFQLDAKFSGTFFTGHFEKQKKKNHEVNYRINQTRPYYIWAFGGDKEIGSLVRNSRISDIGIKNSLVLTHEGEARQCRVVVKRDYDVDKRDRTHVVNATLSGRSNSFDVTVNATFKDLPLNDDYVLDINNYETSNSKYSVSNVVKNDNGEISITVSSQRVVAGDLNITLKAQLPQWVEELDMNPDWDIRNDGFQQKTYGLKALIDGVKRGMISNDTPYTTLKIRIN